MNLTVTLSTCESKREALRIAQTLVEERLAACVNLIPGVTSVYRWQGKVHEHGEILLLIKSTRDGVKRLTKRLRELHSYQVPEVVTLASVGGNPKYEAWVNESVGSGKRRPGR